MPGRVHVVDDDASFRTAIERRLTLAGYKVATYPSAQQLLDCPPDESEPSCILLDVRIPGLSGPELQGRLSELGSTLPIVFLTGHADTPTTVRAIKAGAEDFLTKPVESKELLGAIERAMARHAITRGEQLTDLEWEFSHYGPCVKDVKQVAETDSAFEVVPTKNLYGGQKDLIQVADDITYPSVTEDEKELLDYVISSSASKLVF